MSDALQQQVDTVRTLLEIEVFDAANGLMKFSPLADWSDAQVWEYIRAKRVPYNALHDRHYPSIGCVPCTRAVTVGEDSRSGRWWWEDTQQKECGLHPLSGKRGPARNAHHGGIHTG